MKKYKLLSLFMVLVIASICISAPINTMAVELPARYVQPALSTSAILINESDIEYKLIPENNPNRAVLMKYKGTDTRIILPETAGGYPLSSISASAFQDCKNLEYIRLSSQITSVNAKCFGATSKLKAIDVDKNNEKIVSVNGVVFNKNMTTLYAFPNGVGGAYTIPNGVVSISQGAFYRCTYITDITMPATVESIGDEAFYYCPELDNVRLSYNLSSIGNYAFAYCDDLASLNLPYSLSHIGKDAFLGYISSEDHKVYHLVDGLYFVPGSYAESYVKQIHLPLEVQHQVDSKITDYETGVTIIDVDNILPNTSKLQLSVEVLPSQDYEHLIHGNFSKLYCYNITLTNDGEEISLSDRLIIKFDGLDEDTVLSAARVYHIDGDVVKEYKRAPQTPFVGANTKSFGTYVVAVSDDFSLKGDINGDGIISSYDAQMALSATAKITTLTTQQFTVADYNGDGKITTQDALLILRKAADII